MKDLFSKITYKDLIDYFFGAEEYIYLASPGIFQEWSAALVEARGMRPDLEIQLIIDPTEDSFRKYMGETASLIELQEMGITVKEYKHHRLGFVITDQAAFFLSRNSRAIEKKVQGFNAVRMNTTTKASINMQCFDRQSTIENKDGSFAQNVEDELNHLKKVEEEILSNGQTALAPDSLNEEMFREVQENLKQNPPVSPDFKRLINVYSTEIKFVEFEVQGVKIANKSVRIPSHILQLADDDLQKQIKTRLDVFNDNIKEKANELIKPIQSEADHLRKEYFCRITSRKKNVMEANKQKEFEQKVDQLRTEYKNVQFKTNELMHKALEDVKVRLIEELTEIIKQNPTDNLKQYAEKGQLGIFAESEAKEMVKGIKIPSLASLASSFKIEHRFFDPTYEDFSDNEFIEELFENKFINSNQREEIIKETKAMGVQPGK